MPGLNDAWFKWNIPFINETIIVYAHERGHFYIWKYINCYMNVKREIASKRDTNLQSEWETVLSSI